MRVVAGLTAFMLASCSTSNECPYMDFQEFRVADRALITVDSNAIDDEIRSVDRLRALVDFAEEHNSGWSSPVFGPPIARLSVQFFVGNRFLGDFGVGTDFLAAQGCGYFYSRAVSAADRQKLIALIGVPDPYATAKR